MNLETLDSQLIAAQAQVSDTQTELQQIGERLAVLHPLRSMVTVAHTPGEKLEKLLGGGKEEPGQEYNRLIARQDLLQKVSGLAYEEMTRVARERSAQLKRQARPELNRLRSQAIDAMDKLADAIAAIDAFHLDLAKRGADTTSGFVLGNDLLNAIDLNETAQRLRIELEREAIVWPPAPAVLPKGVQAAPARAQQSDAGNLGELVE
jgi:hypothetical protein